MRSRSSTERRSSGGSGGLLLLLLGLMMMMMMVVVEQAESFDHQEVLEEEEEEEEEEEAVSSEDQDPKSSDESRVSARSSWLVFRRNSNKGVHRRTKGSRRTSKHGLPGLPGPPGPAGPQGPPGPPGSMETQQQDLIEDLRLRLRADLQCDRPPRVSTSFSRRLLQDVSVPRRSLQELQLFSTPSDPEQTLQRGQTFNSSTGRYLAPLSGFYQFTASLLIESRDRVQVRVRDSVRAAICIESLCLNKLSVQSVTGAAAAGGTFSILLTGTLYLQVGEYVSLFVDNSTGSSISILKDSQFSGILLGV